MANSGFAQGDSDEEQCAMCGEVATDHLSTKYDDSVFLCKNCMKQWIRIHLLKYQNMKMYKVLRRTLKLIGLWARTEEEDGAVKYIDEILRITRKAVSSFKK